MTTALIDPQGFPRSDIDVAGVRTARVQIIRLRNDLEGVRGEMGRLVERGLPRGDRLAEGEEEHRREEGEGETAREREVPFAKVDGVFPGSPADVAVSTVSRRLSSFLSHSPLLTSPLALEGSPPLRPPSHPLPPQFHESPPPPRGGPIGIPIRGGRVAPHDPAYAGRGRGAEVEFEVDA